MRVVVVDPQEDFCNKDWGSLYVAGADLDMMRLASFIRQKEQEIDVIYITLDAHQYIDVAHPAFWVDKQGKHPAPFTIITHDEVKNGVWIPVLKDRIKGLVDRMIGYTKALEISGKFPLCIWPPHCVIGTPGSNVVAVLWQAIRDWQDNTGGQVRYVTKGSNIFTENYSAVKAEVPDLDDPKTQYNDALVQSIEIYEGQTVYAGEASSHCFAETVMDIANGFKDAESVKNMVILKDACSPVTGFEEAEQKFLETIEGKGATITTIAQL